MRDDLGVVSLRASESALLDLPAHMKHPRHSLPPSSSEPRSASSAKNFVCVSPTRRAILGSVRAKYPPRFRSSPPRPSCSASPAMHPRYPRSPHSGTLKFSPCARSILPAQTPITKLPSRLPKAVKRTTVRTSHGARIQASKRRLELSKERDAPRRITGPHPEGVRRWTSRPRPRHGSARARPPRRGRTD